MGTSHLRTYGQQLMLGAATALLAGSLGAQGFPKQEAKLVAAVPTIGGTFGYSVGLSGDTAAIGDSHGSAHAFVRTGTNWVEQAQLSAPGSVGYGYSIAISGNVAVVGDPQSNGILWIGPGAAYVFRRHGTAWSLEATLTEPDFTPQSLFGEAVSISGDTVVVGDYRVDAAYVFVRQQGTWSEQAKLTGSIYFGDSVSVSGDTAIVGGASGAVEVFVRTGTTWSHQATLSVQNETTLGRNVALSGDTAVCNGDHGAYAFARTGTTWALQGVLASPATMAVATVAVSDADNVVVVGDPEAAVGQHSNAGVAYIYVRTAGSWHQQGVMVASDPADGDGFGQAVAVSGETALAGADLADVGTVNASGAVYVFDPIEPFSLLGGGLAGVSGIPLLVGAGPLDPGSSGSLTLSNAAPFALSELFVSLANTPTPFKGGVLNTIPIAFQLPVGTFFTGSWTLPWSAWPAGIPSGSLLYFQAAVSDATAPKGVSISNLLRATQP